jgi:hypothetical protein
MDSKVLWFPELDSTFFTLNVDGAAKGNLWPGGAGGNVCTSKGHLVFAFSMSLSFSH